MALAPISSIPGAKVLRCGGIAVVVFIAAVEYNELRG